MGYLGNIPGDKFLTLSSQQITGTGSDTYTLDYPVSSSSDIAVFVNNVRQNVSSYTASNTTLTLGGTISASDECWVHFLGKSVGSIAPATGSVTNAMLAGSIATSKLADITANGITMADQWRLTTPFSCSTGQNDINTNLERTDNASFGYVGTGMTETSGVFTFPATGIYYITATISFYRNTSSTQYTGIAIRTTINNSSYDTPAENFSHVDNVTSQSASAVTSYLFDVTDTSLCKVKFAYESQSTSVNVGASSSKNNTYFTFIRLGDT